MTPEQRNQFQSVWDKYVGKGEANLSGLSYALRQFIDDLLAAERAAVVAECANVCKRLAEAMEQGAGELAPGGRLRQAENTIRDLGKAPVPPVRYCRICGAIYGNCPPPGCG